MKKANLINLLIVFIIFSVFYIVDLILTNNNIDIYFKINIAPMLKTLILILIYFLLMISSMLYASRSVFNLYIAHIRKTKLFDSQYALGISSLITSYSFLFFKVEFYYYFGSIILLYILYFISLFLYDNTFIKKQQKVKVNVNEEIVQSFLDSLGGKDNILSLSYAYSRLKVELNDISKVNLDNIKSLGASGVFVAGNKLQAIIGSNAAELEKAIQNCL
ncbi:MAG TPA: PTS transporter subunit EIIB [Haloplasmataceae bacterium]